MLDTFKEAFEGKLLYGYGFAVDEVSVLYVKHSGKSYPFLRLDGNFGTPTKEFPDPPELATKFFLITDNHFLRKNESADRTSYMARRAAARFGAKPRATVEVEQRATHPSPSTCIHVELNHATKTAKIVNISVHSFCRMDNMDDLMGVVDALLRKVKWTGKVTLDDHARKNGASVALHYMRTRKGDKFSKYQDYGFKVKRSSLPELRRIKRKVLAGEEVDLADLLSDMTKRMTRKKQKIWSHNQ